MTRGPLLAAAILMALVSASGLLGVVARSVHLDNSRAIQEKRDMLRRVTAIADQSGAVEAWAADMSVERDGGVLLVGESPALIAAELQSQLGTFAAESGAGIKSLRSMEPVGKDGLTTIGVGIDVQASLASLHQLLQRIEASKPLLFVEKMQIRASYIGTPREGDVVLEAQLEISGYARTVDPLPES